MKKAIGVNRRKNISPSTIGLTIIPSNNPKCIHNLLKGSSTSALTIVVTNNKNDSVAKPYASDELASFQK